MIFIRNLVAIILELQLAPRGSGLARRPPLESKAVWQYLRKSLSKELGWIKSCVLLFILPLTPDHSRVNGHSCHRSSSSQPNIWAKDPSSAAAQWLQSSWSSISMQPGEEVSPSSKSKHFLFCTMGSVPPLWPKYMSHHTRDTHESQDELIVPIMCPSIHKWPY